MERVNYSLMKSFLSSLVAELQRSSSTTELCVCVDMCHSADAWYSFMYTDVSDVCESCKMSRALRCCIDLPEINQ